MRIITLTTLFPNSMQRNLGVFIKHRIAALARYGDVKVVAPIPWCPGRLFPCKAKVFNSIPAFEVIDGLEVYHPRYLLTPKVGRRYYGSMYYYSLRRFMKNFYSAFPCDIVDVHWAYPDGFAGVLFGKMLNCPVSISLRGSDIHTYIQYPARKKRIAWALQQADLVIPVAASMHPIVESLGVSASKIHAIPNGVNNDDFCYVPREEARCKLGLLPEQKTILAVGRLHPPKRFDLLISALASLKNKRDLQLIIVGDGPLRHELEVLSKKNGVTEQVSFVGEKPNNELYLWYNSAELFCLASDREGCPNVLIESLACGTPVIASDVGGAADIIDSKELGLLVHQNNINSWSDALFKATSIKWERNTILQSQKKNNWDISALKLNGLFENIVYEKMKTRKALGK